MADNSKTQLGYFIKFPFWQDAIKLLNFQIGQRKTNRHYYTLSMFYYERLETSCIKIDEEYYKRKIASSLFYGLKKEFAVFPFLPVKMFLIRKTN
jgi:hypothetical protein